MFVLLFGLAGALIGGFTARRRKGSGLDIAQYAAAYAIAFALLGLFINIFIIRAV
ncbi:hypothetical protein SAMN05421688_0723 [Poseidonocella pacifica]|uniref:PEP-CTERM protein-sorting domain-containing protein n=1 Tax=Poseidonocella pacifica TaxID=871651 RepID=A0A1I0VK68_9RHOB|nr:hypothetical protein [Poseidonocella pacifica]SFA76795.1 hypothetical protein SAMN05421688_0723 [Poseidonocella pacifica]